MAEARGTLPSPATRSREPSAPIVAERIATPSLLQASTPASSSGGSAHGGACNSDVAGDPACRTASSTSSSTSFSSSSSDTAVEVIITSVGAAGPKAAASADIYSVWSRTQRRTMLALVVIAVLLPGISNTIYLPVIEAIQSSLGTSTSMVLATVTAYMAAEGMTVVASGPVCDAVGRKAFYVCASLAFVATSLGCAFVATSGEVLLVLRTLQGVAAGMFPAAGNGVVADVWAPHERGTITAITFIPLMVTPIVAPILGGVLGQAFGWRAIFVLLAGFAGLLVPAMLLLLPETSHYKLLRSLEQRDPSFTVAGADDIRSHPPSLRRALRPWAPLLIVAQPAVVLHLLVGLLSFAPAYAGLVLAIKHLSERPFLWPSGALGTVMLTTGLAAVVAALLGGCAFDRAARSHPASSMARLRWHTAVVMLCSPACLVLFGAGLMPGAHPALLFGAALLLGAGAGFHWPAIMTYVTCLHQQDAATAATGCTGAQLVATGIAVVLAERAVAVMGPLPVFAGLAGSALLAAGIAAALQIRCHMRAEAACASSAAKQPEAASGPALV